MGLGPSSRMYEADEDGEEPRRWERVAALALAQRLLEDTDLGIDAGSVGLDAAWSTVIDTTPRPPKEAGKVVSDADGAGGTALVEFLAAGKFI